MDILMASTNSSSSVSNIFHQNFLSSLAMGVSWYYERGKVWQKEDEDSGRNICFVLTFFISKYSYEDNLISECFFLPFFSSFSFQTKSSHIEMYELLYNDIDCFSLCKNTGKIT